ncbi:MAG: hypothetical protein IT158_28795 [Bryobacterales bacterium]|nr:hypothetical protein [Bryobacterales bacterium]
MKSRRRTFLQTVALSGLAPAAPGQDDRAAQGTRRAGARSGIAYPRTFTGRQLAMIAFPLGGVGAGSIALGGRGQLRDWEIFNRPDKGKAPSFAFASIWARSGSRKPVARVLESRILPPYEGPSGLGTNSAPGLPRLRSAAFTGEFPLAAIAFRDAALPAAVRLEAFTPFIPLDADESGLPVAVLRYNVRNPAAVPLQVSIAWSLDNPVGAQGRMNEHRAGQGIEGLYMHNPLLAGTDPLAGSFVLAALDPGTGKLTYQPSWREGRWWVGPLLFWDDFSSDGELSPVAERKSTVGSLCLSRELKPGGEADFTFLLAWHFPNRTPERCGWRAAKGEEKTVIGNWYSSRFRDAWEAAQYAAERLPGLESRTRAFVQAMRDSTLPGSVRDAATANLSTFVSTTCFRTADGAFHAFEGSNNDRGCCYGNCTHVWNYEAATPHLFPSLSRSLREAAFGFSTDPEGRMDFRQILPAGKERNGQAATDGQMGAIMKLYLDWRLSGDTEWLKRHWPAARRALEFSWVPGGWDADRDGVMEGVQHNTYDVEFYGPNPLCGIWYLGALRAGEEMARAAGDNGPAGEYRRLFESGSRWIDANLFNGQYYVQKVRGIPKDQVARGLTVGMGAADPNHPDFQAGEGCLVDQLLGQYLAHIAGLGYLLNPKNIATALASVYKYNYRESLETHESVQRIYALNDEAALVICDYSRAERPEVPFPYFAEAWTGLEYSTAAHMMFEGLVTQGVRVVENVRRRHDGEKRNPWNEPECGHHYARAMAAWALVVALSGFRCHAGEKSIEAKPRIRPENFTCFWSGGTAWGTFSQTAGPRGLRFRLAVKGGTLECRKVQLAALGTPAPKTAVRAGGTALEHRVERAGKETVVTLARAAVLKGGEELEILV